MASLGNLPVELVAWIGELTDPVSHLDLVCTFSFIAASMKDILKRHRTEYAKLPCSDLHPLTIPRLLRAVIADPFAAHHVKTIKTVNYARTSYVFTEDSLDVGNASLAWLGRIAVCHRDQDIKAWPPGLQSLRCLNVGVENGAVFDVNIHHVYHPLFMARILNLPNLEAIYLHGLGCRRNGDDDENGIDYPLTPGCSSIRHIYVEQLDSLHEQYWGQVDEACKSQLTSIAFDGGESHDIDAYIGGSIQSALNMQSVMVYGAGLTGYRCELFYPKDVLGGYSNPRDLRVVTVAISDLQLEAWCEDPTYGQDFIDYLIGAGDDPALPSGLEVLLLAGNFEVGHDDSDRVSRLKKVAGWIDDGLAAMISCTGADQKRNGRRTRGEEVEKERKDAGQQQNNEEHEEDESDDGDEDWHIFPDLKAIYIEPWEGNLTPEAMQSSSELWMQKSIQAGIKRGVDVRTRTNVHPPLHRNLKFHTAPNRYDLRPDITPLANHDFDPLKGRWVDRGCWNCGDCEDCFALFPKGLWAQTYRAPHKEDQEGEEEEEGEVTDGAEDELQPEEMFEEEPVRFGTREEIWTRVSRKAEPNHWVECGYRIQRLNEYQRDRQCCGEEHFSRLDRGMSPIVLPKTARSRAFFAAD